jgi:hypothetical protein
MYRRKLKSKRAGGVMRYTQNRTQSQRLPSGNSDTVPRGMPYSNDGIVIERTFQGIRSQSGATSNLNLYFAVNAGQSWRYDNAIFQINDLPGFTDFVSVFGEYKILEAELIFVPCANTFNAPVVGGETEQPVLHIATDVDGIQNNTTLDKQLQYASNRICANIQGEIRHKIRPKYYASVQNQPTGLTTNSGTQTGYISLSSGSTGGSVDHYGVAIGMSTISPADRASPMFQTFTRLKVALRHVL